MLYLVFFLIKGFCIVFPFAERPGFEPGNRFGRLHAFQACLFSHSSISPRVLFEFCGCKSSPFLRHCQIKQRKNVEIFKKGGYREATTLTE